MCSWNFVSARYSMGALDEIDCLWNEIVNVEEGKQATSVMYMVRKLN